MNVYERTVWINPTRPDKQIQIKLREKRYNLTTQDRTILEHKTTLLRHERTILVQPTECYAEIERREIWDYYEREWRRLIEPRHLYVTWIYLCLNLYIEWHFRDENAACVQYRNDLFSECQIWEGGPHLTNDSALRIIMARTAHSNWSL